MCVSYVYQDLDPDLDPDQDQDLDPDPDLDPDLDLDQDLDRLRRRDLIICNRTPLAPALGRRGPGFYCGRSGRLVV